MGVNDAVGLEKVQRALYSKLMSGLRRLFGLNLFLVQYGDDKSKVAPPTLEEGYTTRTCTPEQLKQWASSEVGLPISFLDDAQKRGDRCVANFFHDDLVGYVFVAKSNAPLTNQLEVAIDNRLVYRYKAWTHPNHRRKHLSMARGRLNKTLFPLQPGQRTIAYVATTNFPSRLVRPEIHPQAVGYSGYFKLAGREIPFNTPGTRRAGFKVQRRKR